MSGQRLVPLAVTALMLGLATASAQYAPGGSAPRRAPVPEAQSDVGGARPQDAAAELVPSDAEPLQSPGHFDGGTPRRAPASDAQSDAGGARPQDAAALPVPSHAEPLQSPGDVDGGATAGQSTGEGAGTGERSASRSSPSEALASGRAVGAGAAGLGGVLRPDERVVIRDVVRRADVIARVPECRYEEKVDLAIGRPFPRTTRVCRLPDEVQAKVPASRRYRYLMAGNRIVLINPDDAHRIVEVIE